MKFASCSPCRQCGKHVFSFLSLCKHFALCIQCKVHSFVCVVFACASNDAVGHDRRWHLLLMMTSTRGEPCGQASGKEKQEGGRRDTNQYWHQYTVQQGETHSHTGLSNGKVLALSSFFKIMHADFKSHSEFSPKRAGHPFCLSVGTETSLRWLFYENASTLGLCDIMSAAVL